MYDKNKLVAALAVLILIFLAIAGMLLLNIILTKIAIWSIEGIFNIDLSTKFWHVFSGIIVLSVINSGGININLRNSK